MTKKIVSLNFLGSKDQLTLVISLIFSLCSLSSVAGRNISQDLNSKISLHVENQPVSEVLKQINKEVKIGFIFSNEVITDEKVTLHVKEEKLSQVLRKIFDPLGLTYSVTDNLILIEKKEKAARPAKARAQQRVSGRVTDRSGEPLPGVSIKLKGTDTGTSTDAEGNYAITVPDGSTVLVFTFIGFQTQEVTVGDKTTINVVLAEESKSLTEVVVTAMGISRETKALPYSVTEVGGEEFTQAREVNLANALTGKIAGVDATQIASGPGGSSRVVIRGNGSLSGNQQPLYVVNGLPINNENRSAAANTTGANVDRGDGISSINPDDIESISVLKGGAAAALYGSQAANGVILITTKKGRAQKGVGVEFNSNTVFQRPSEYPDWQYEYGQGNDGVKPATQQAAISSGRLSYGARIDGQPSIQFDGVERPYSAVNVKDNINNFYRTGVNATNTLAFFGGSEALTYRLSLSDLEGASMMRNSSFDRRTANLNVKSVLAKKLTIESTIQYNAETGKNRTTVGYAEVNPAWAVNLIANTVDIRSLSPGYNPETGREIEWNPVPAANNPYFIMNRVGNEDNRQRIIAQGSLRYDLLPNLFIKGNVLRDVEASDEFAYLPVGTAFVPRGNYQSGTYDRTRTNAQVIANYNATFLDDFTMNALAGANMERYSDKRTWVNGQDFVIPDFISYTNLSAVTPGKSHIRQGTNSLFGSVDFGYKGILYVSATGRQDWFSTLNPGSNSIFYPSIGGSFVASEAFNLPKAFDLLKLRGSWAQVGSATVLPGTINSVYTFTQGGHLGRPVQSRPLDNNLLILNNPDLRPLTSTTIEAGLDLRLFGRIGVDLTLYDRKTTDDIINVLVSQTSGYNAAQVNVGEIRNKGIELMLTGTVIKRNSFSWDMTANGAYNKNEILKLAPGISNISIGTGIGGANIINEIGKPYATIRAWVMRKDANGNQVYNATSGYEDRVEQDLGTGNPPLTLGFNNEFRYKNFNFSFLLDGKFGHVVYSNLMQYAHRFGLTKETLPGRETGLTVSGVDQAGAPFTKTWPVEQLDTYYNNQGTQYTGLFVYDADFVKLRQVILGYNLPVDKFKLFKLQGANISIVARNLAILFRHNKNFDPEAGYQTTNVQGVAAPTLPRTRDIGLNLSVRF